MLVIHHFPWLIPTHQNFKPLLMNRYTRVTHILFYNYTILTKLKHIICQCCTVTADTNTLTYVIIQAFLTLIHIRKWHFDCRRKLVIVNVHVRHNVHPFHSCLCNHCIKGQSQLWSIYKHFRYIANAWICHVSRILIILQYRRIFS